MEFALFRSIVDEATRYGPRSYSLHLFGEPLLYPKILEAISYIKTKNKKNTILLTTNGTLLNQFAPDLKKLRVDRIIWSYRRNNFTDDTINVLKEIGMVRLLVEETPKEEFEKWAKFPRVEVKSLHNYGGSIDVSKWGLSNDINGKLAGTRYPCYHLWFAPAIRWNGEIVECCNIAKSGTHVLAVYGERTLAEVWKGSKLGQLRDAHLKGIYPGACEKCTSWQAYPSIFFGHQCS